MEAKDTILAGCEIICIGEQPTDLVACPLSDEEQEKCRSRRQYESGRQAGLREGGQKGKLNAQVAGLSGKPR